MVYRISSLPTLLQSNLTFPSDFYAIVLEYFEATSALTKKFLTATSWHMDGFLKLLENLRRNLNSCVCRKGISMPLAAFRTFFVEMALAVSVKSAEFSVRFHRCRLKIFFSLAVGDIIFLLNYDEQYY
jgi:hypothetical protein